MNPKLATGLIFFALSFPATIHANDAREQAARVVAQIQRADYEGDRAAMQRGYDELKAFMEDYQLAPRIRYWRGFAQWRQAINGFNDAVDPKELETSTARSTNSRSRWKRIRHSSTPRSGPFRVWVISLS